MKWLILATMLTVAAPALAEDTITITVHAPKTTIDIAGPRQEVYCEAQKIAGDLSASLDIPKGNYQQCSSATNGSITLNTCGTNCFTTVPNLNVVK